MGYVIVRALFTGLFIAAKLMAIVAYWVFAQLFVQVAKALTP